MSHPRFQLPTPPPSAPSPTAFLLFPLACLPSRSTEELAQQQALYQKAFEQAQQVVQPSILERDLIGVWN